MATYLDALATLVTDPVARRSYRRSPAAWLSGNGAPQLTGEDVEAALPVLRQWCPDQARALPAVAIRPVEPARDETDLDAAVRQVDHLLAGLDAARP